MTKVNMFKSLAVAGFLAAAATLTVGQVAFGQVGALKQDAKAAVKDAARAGRQSLGAGQSGAAAAKADKGAAKTAVGSTAVSVDRPTVKTGAANDSNYAGATVCNLSFLDSATRAAGRIAVEAGIVDASCGASMASTKEGQEALRNALPEAAKFAAGLKAEGFTSVAQTDIITFNRLADKYVDLKHDGAATPGSVELQNAVRACANDDVFSADVKSMLN